MSEPITLAEAKDQLRVVGDADNAAINDAIADARGWVEDYTGHILVRRTLIEQLGAFGHKLRAWPIVSIDVVSYADAAGSAVTLDPAAYRGAVAVRPGRLVLPTGYRWPTLSLGGAVTVTMTAGYADADAIPGPLLRAMRLLITAFYDDRAGGELFQQSVASAKALCRPKRLMGL